MGTSALKACKEKWDLAHNGLPSDIKDCFVRLKRLSQTEIKMLARSPRKRTSESDFILGPSKRKFKRIVLPNDNSEDEDSAISSAANGNSSQEVEVPKISIDEATSLSSRKSEVDGQKVTEAVKKSDLSHSRRGSQELQNNSARMRKVTVRKSETDGENVTEAVKKSDSSNSSGGSRELQKNSSGMRKVSDRKSEVDGEKVTEAVNKSDSSNSSGGSLELQKSSSGIRKISDRKSEVDGEKVTEAVKKSESSHSRRGSQELKNNSAGTRKVNIRKSETDSGNVTEAVKKSDSSNSSGGSQELQKNSSGMRKVSDRKSEVDGENVNKAAKKCDLNHSSGGSQESKNNLAGMKKVSDRKSEVDGENVSKAVMKPDLSNSSKGMQMISKEKTNCSINETKSCAKKRPGNIFGKKQEPVSKNPKLLKEVVVKDAVSSERNSEERSNYHKNCLGAEKKLLTLNRQQNKIESQAPASRSASCDKGHENPELTPKMSYSKFGDTNPPDKINEGFHHLKDEERSQENKGAASLGAECEVERVLAQIFDSPSKASNENIFFNSKDIACDSSNAKVTLNYEKKCSKEISESASKIPESSKSCDKQHDVPKDLTKLNHVPKKNSIDSHASLELKGNNSKALSGANHDNSDLIAIKKIIGTVSSNSIKESFSSTYSRNDEPKQNCSYPYVSAGGESEKNQRSKSTSDNTADSRVLSIDSENHANSEKKNCNKPTLSAWTLCGRSDKIQRSKSMADNVRDSRVQQPLVVDSEKHANTAKKNCNNPTVSACGRSDKIQRCKSMADNAGDSWVPHALSIDSEKHENNEKRNCDTHTFSDVGRSDTIERSESMADNAGDSKVQQPLSIDSEKHANNEKRNSNNPTVSACGRSDKIQRSKSVPDNTRDSKVPQALSIVPLKHADNEKRNCDTHMVSDVGRSDKIQRSKSMADNAEDSRVQQPLSIDSEKHANNGKSLPSITQLLFSRNETKKLVEKPGTPNFCSNKMNKKVSKGVGGINVGKTVPSQITLNQVDRAMKKINRSLSVGNAPITSVGELKTIHLAQSPKSPVRKPRSPPHPVKSKFKKVDGDWIVSTISKDASSTKTGNLVDISNDFPENKEKLHFFSKETVSAGNLSKVIEKCRQKIVASIQMKEKASSGSLLDGNNKSTIDRVIRTPLKTYEPSICGNVELRKEIDGTNMVQSNPEMMKATDTPKRVSKCQKLSKDEKTSSLRKSIQEMEEIHETSVGSNEKCPSPSPGIVAENIDELMREYEQLTNRTAPGKTSTKKKIERRPSQKKLLTMFGEEHFIEDCQSILQHPLTSEEKAFPGKQFLSNEIVMDGADHASLAGKEPDLTSLDACSERVLINDKASSYSKLKAGKKRYLSESFQRKKHIEKGRRNSSGSLSGVEVTGRELIAIQGNLLEKSESFTCKQCSVISTKKANPFDSISKLDSHGEKSKTVLKNSKISMERHISAEKLCTGEDESSIAKRSHNNDASPKINQSKGSQEIRSSESVAEDIPSKCLGVENVCKTQENESISVRGGISRAYEANPSDPKLRHNLNVRPDEKEIIGRKEGFAEIIEAADGKVMSQVPIVSSDPESPACENSSSALCSSTTVECDKEMAIDSPQTSLLQTMSPRKTTDGGNESSVDEEKIVSNAKKLEDTNSSLLLSLGLLSGIPVQPLSAVQDSLENPEYVKKLEQQHEVLEKLVGEAMAQKSLIWKQLQSYHGIVEVKKEVPDDSSDDDCQIIFSAGDVSCIKEDSNSSADTEVIDQLDDSAQKDISVEDQDSELSSREISESGNQNPSLKTSEHSGRRCNRSNSSSTDEFRTGSKDLNEKDLHQLTLKIENSGNVEDVNENYSRNNVGENIADSSIPGPDGFISGMNADTDNLNRNTVQSSTLQQSKDLEVDNTSTIPPPSQSLTSPEELPVSESTTVIVFCNGNVNRPLISSPNNADSTQTINVLNQPDTTLDSVRGISPSLQSSDKDSAIKPSKINLAGDLMNSREESADLNSSGKTVTSVNSSKNIETQLPNNVVSVREERIRVRGMKDLMENPATVSSVTAVECHTGDTYLKECFISEDGVSLFNYLVFYMLKIAQKIEEFMDRNSSSSTEISEVEDTYKENCVIIYDLFMRSVARFKADPNSFITILFMKMVTEWKNFKGLLTLDSLKSVIKKCFGKCLELMSPGKRGKFVSEANELLAKMRIFPPLVHVDQAAVSKRAGISDGAIIRSNSKANQVMQSSNSTTVSFPLVQQQGSIVSNQNNYSYGGNNPPRYIENTISQVQQAQRPSLNNQIQMNPNVMNDGGVVGHSTMLLPAGRSDITRAPMLNNGNPNERQPPSEFTTQRNVALANINLPSSRNISSLHHLLALTRNSQTRGTANPGSCIVTNGKPYVLPKSSSVVTANIPQASGRNILQSSGINNLCHQNNTPQSYSPSSANINSRVYQPMMGRPVFNSASNSVQRSSAQAQNGRAEFYPKTTAQEAHQNALQNTGYGTSGNTSSIPTSSNKPKNPNNALSSSGENVTPPQILSAMRPSLLGNYYGANVSSSSVGAVRSSQTSMTASSGVPNATVQQLSSNHVNAMLLAQGSSVTPVSSLSAQGRHRNSSGLGQSASLPLAINPITRQPIQAQRHPQEQALENDHFPGMNGYQISCQVTVNPSFQYNPNNSRGSLSTRGSSESVRTAGPNATDFCGTPASQHMNVNSIFQNIERNRQIPLGHSLSTTSTLAAQSYPEHQLLMSNTHSASRLNPAHDTNSVNVRSSSMGDNRRYTLGNLRFLQSRTDVAVDGNSFGQSQIAANNFSTVHSYQQLNQHEASPDNASQLHSSNLQHNTRSDLPSYPYSLSLMKQAEARSSMQPSLPGPVHPSSPVIFPDDSDQGRGQGTNRSVSRDSGYRSPSQVNEVDPCYVCGKEARNTCSGCKSVFYCQHECQMGDWKRHRWECRPTN